MAIPTPRNCSPQISNLLDQVGSPRLGHPSNSNTNIIIISYLGVSHLIIYFLVNCYVKLLKEIHCRSIFIDGCSEISGFKLIEIKISFEILEVLSTSFPFSIFYEISTSFMQCYMKKLQNMLSCESNRARRRKMKEKSKFSILEVSVTSQLTIV